MKKLEDLNKGDVINIQFGFNVHKAKVLANDVNDQLLLLKIGRWLWFYGFLGTDITKYSCYKLKHYNLLNK